jgi:myo-inositol-1(or 4)-monophosphatase
MSPTGDLPADPVELLEVAADAAAAGAAVAVEWFGRIGSLRVEEKTGPGDLVTRADRETETAIRDVLSARRPDDAVLGEELSAAPGTSGVEWVVDPIDGTTDFVYGRPDWSVSVAARGDAGQLLAAVINEPIFGAITAAARGHGTTAAGEPVRLAEAGDLDRALVEINLGRGAMQQHRAGPLVDALAPNVRDLRRGGSAAASLARVATGRADAAWLPGLQPWDCAAGVLLVTEAGGAVGDLAGQSGAAVPRSGNVLASSPGLWDQLQQILLAVYGDGPPGERSR